MEPSPDRNADPSLSVSLVEIVTFLGITAGLYGTFLVLALGQVTQGLIGLVSFVLMVVFLLAGALIGADAPDRLGRLRSICWYLSVQFFSSMLQAWMLDASSLLSGFSDLMVVYVLTAVYAFTLWLFMPRLLQQLAFYSALIAFLVALVFPAPTSFAFGPPDLTGVALVLWLAGAGWFALGYAGRIRPPRVAMVLGVLTSLVGPLFFAAQSVEGAFVVVLATSGVYLILGGLVPDRAVSGIAIVGVVIGLAGLLVAMEVNSTTSGTTAIILGAALLVVGVLLARRIGGSRPSLGRPVLPIGPKVVAVTADAPGAADEPVTPVAPVVPPPPEEPEPPAAEPTPPAEPEPPDDR